MPRASPLNSFLFSFSRGREFLISVPFFYISVAYKSDEVEYSWKDDSAVNYEGRLQLSQFDIKHTEFRGLNYSRRTDGDSSRQASYLQ